MRVREVHLWGCLGQCSAGDGLPIHPSPLCTLATCPGSSLKSLSLGSPAPALPVIQFLLPPMGQAGVCVAIRGRLLSCDL